MDPFLPKKETEYVDDIFVKKTIKEKLNKPRKEVKFTWEGLKNFVPFLETNPFDPLKVKRIKELTEGAPAKEKDYIEGYEEIEKALYGGVQDLGYSVSSLLTEGIDAAFDTKYLDALDKAYDAAKALDIAIKGERTIMSGLVSLQFIQDVMNVLVDEISDSDVLGRVAIKLKALIEPDKE